jgi:outer membrane protein OmpA-like peptidoglycan-associated protein
MSSIWKQIINTIIACVLLVVGVVSVAYGGDETTLKGLITGRTGETMKVQTQDSDEVTVLLTDDTKTQAPKGVFRHKQMSMAELIPGLRVKIKGIKRANGQFEARTVEFNSEDLKTANAINAGLLPTQKAVIGNQQAIAANAENIQGNKQQVGAAQQQISANQLAVEQRFADLTDFDVKEKKVVYFNSGRAELTPRYKSELLALAHNASTLKGYLIEVQGFCDSTGTAAQNQALSRDRAEAVIGFLQQTGNIPMRRILAPGAMGTVNPVASNETTAGRSENRRVEVKVLVNKGLNPVAAKSRQT